MGTVQERLAAAWVALNAAAQAPDHTFWATFDEVERQTLDGLEGPDRVMATQTLHAYLAKLKGFASPEGRR